MLQRIPTKASSTRSRRNPRPLVNRFDSARTFAPLVKIAYGPEKAHAAKLRKQKERLLDKGYVELPVVTRSVDYDDLIAACETWAGTDVDCADDPDLIRAVEAVRARRPGWENDPAVIGVILSRVAIAHWIEKVRPRSQV